jgi:RNA polymerase sigma factor for flagellar operon FliA
MRSTGERSPETKTIVLADLWRRYHATGDRDARDQLIVAYAPIVKSVAGRIGAGMPSHVDVADLVSYGLAGLIEAVERFDPARGVSFETYGAMRARGAIYDALRSLDWVPRSVREEARSIEGATSALLIRLRRLPTDAELAHELRIDPGELHASLQRVADSRMLALEQPVGATAADGQRMTLLETLPDPNAVDPAAAAAATDLRDRIFDVVGHMPEREQLVLGLRYTQDLSFQQIGEVLGLTDARVSRIHAKAVLQLGVVMRDRLRLA